MFLCWRFANAFVCSCVHSLLPESAGLTGHKKKAKKGSIFCKKVYDKHTINFKGYSSMGPAVFEGCAGFYVLKL